MSINKIFCFGDGYAHGHIWPEWPQILQALLPSYHVITGTAVGAGNEFLIDTLLNLDCAGHTVIFQWAQANRFDKLIQDQQWKTLGQQDPVYFFNFENNSSGTWWLSSASQNEHVQNYHRFYIQHNQAQLRMKNQKILVKHYLKSINCTHWFTSTQEQEIFCQQHQDHRLRGAEVQPSPIMHFYFVTQQIKPALNLPIDLEKEKVLQKLITQTVWKPYDPDRAEIWRNLCQNLNS